VLVFQGDGGHRNEVLTLSWQAGPDPSLVSGEAQWAAAGTIVGVGEKSQATGGIQVRCPFAFRA
jgi:hypothetical protein